MYIGCVLNGKCAHKDKIFLQTFQTFKERSTTFNLSLFQKVKNRSKIKRRQCCSQDIILGHSSESKIYLLNVGFRISFRYVSQVLPNIQCLKGAYMYIKVTATTCASLFTKTTTTPILNNPASAKVQLTPILLHTQPWAASRVFATMFYTCIKPTFPPPGEERM